MDPLRPPGAPWLLVRLHSVDSTQTVAGDLAEQGAPEGTVVLAELQRAGRGRRGRRWLSPEGGLYLSLILRPRRKALLQTLPLLASLAVAGAVRETTGLPAMVRWPNDVTVGGRKVSGAIAESSIQGRSLSYVVVGVGVNCNAPAPSLPGAGATALAAEVGAPVRVRDLEASILGRFERLYAAWSAGRPLRDAGALLSTPGRTVRVKRSGESRTTLYRVLAIRRDGALEVVRGGERLCLYAEDVEWLREV